MILVIIMVRVGIITISMREMVEIIICRILPSSLSITISNLNNTHRERTTATTAIMVFVHHHHYDRQVQIISIAMRTNEYRIEAILKNECGKEG